MAVTSTRRIELPRIIILYVLSSASFLANLSGWVGMRMRMDPGRCQPSRSFFGGKYVVDTYFWYVNMRCSHILRWRLETASYMYMYMYMYLVVLWRAQRHVVDGGQGLRSTRCAMQGSLLLSGSSLLLYSLLSPSQPLLLIPVYFVRFYRSSLLNYPTRRSTNRILRRRMEEIDLPVCCFSSR